MRQQYSILQIENLPEIGLNDSPTSISQDKIKYRKKRINQLRLRGYTNQQIADEIGCNISTVEKDLHAIRESSRQWYEEDSIIEYCQSLYDAIIIYDNAINDLQILYANEINSELKLKILTKITEFDERKTHLYEKTKTVQNYLRGKFN